MAGVCHLFSRTLQLWHKVPGMVWEGRESPGLLSRFPCARAGVVVGRIQPLRCCCAWSRAGWGCGSCLGWVRWERGSFRSGIQVWHLLLPQEEPKSWSLEDNPAPRESKIPTWGTTTRRGFLSQTPFLPCFLIAVSTQSIPVPPARGRAVQEMEVTSKTVCVCCPLVSLPRRGSPVGCSPWDAPCGCQHPLPGGPPQWAPKQGPGVRRMLCPPLGAVLAKPGVLGIVPFRESVTPFVTSTCCCRWNLP